jgi:hypothetical protein
VACAFITNTEIIVLIEGFYHQEMLILAIKKNTVAVRRSKSHVQKTIFTLVGEKGFIPLR